MFVGLQLDIGADILRTAEIAHMEDERDILTAPNFRRDVFRQDLGIRSPVRHGNSIGHIVIGHKLKRPRRDKSHALRRTGRQTTAQNKAEKDKKTMPKHSMSF